MHRMLFRHDPGIGHTYIPGLRARVPHAGGGYLLRTNRAGFRCRHQLDEPRTTRPRVVLTGDSVTAGDGVSDGRRYGDLLEDLLDVDVVNLALPGTGTDQQHLAWRAHGAGLDADLLVVAVLVENVRRNLEPVRVWVHPDGRTLPVAKPWFTAEEGELVLHGSPVPVRPDRELAARAAPPSPWADALPHYDAAEDPGWVLLARILRRWAADAAPTPVLIVPLPIPELVDGRADPAPVRDRFAELDLPVHDPLPDLVALAPSARAQLHVGPDPHPTIAGHRALADALAPAVADALGAR